MHLSRATRLGLGVIGACTFFGAAVGVIVQLLRGG